ncbi:hypothetical protein FRC19_010079 [Serendipita sp. 401]|nr:hypothetical protein FRC19_010079 [Serendipita sp. 401]
MANHTTPFETNCNAPMQQGGQTSTVHSASDPSSSNPAPTPHSLRHMSSIDSFIVAQDFLSPSTSSTRALLAPLLAAPAPPTILARFAPPQLGLTHNELALFPSIFSSPDQDQNRLLLENLLLSAVLVAVNKGEWKNVQSLADREALEAVFVAEAKGELPPYTTRVGQAIRPPPPSNHQMDQVWAQRSLSRSGNRGEEEERDCVRPRTAPQLCLSQNRSQVESDSRSGGRQLHRIAHSVASEYTIYTFVPCAYHFEGLLFIVFFFFFF